MDYKTLKLDNSANIYPMLTTKHNQNMFRLCCDLKENVDPDKLQQAVDIALPRFECLSMKLMRGFFWYYLATNNAPYKVSKEKDVLFDSISLNNINSYNMRICYYNKRISIEFYHVICDGSGGFELLKSIVHAYLCLCGHKLPGTNILTFDTPQNIEESEDSFVKNYVKQPLKDCKISDLKGEKAFLFKGEYFKRGKTVIRLFADSRQLLGIAREHNATVTELLAAVFAESVKRVYGRIDEKCQLMLPINLRKIFGSQTLRNFSLFSRVPLNLKDDFDSYLLTARKCLKRDTDKEYLTRKISTTVRGEKLLVLRLVPLSLKKLVFDLSNIFVGKSKRTATLSNIGVIKLDKEFDKYIDCFHFQLNSNYPTPLNTAVCTYADKAVISFTNATADNRVIAAFASILTEKGLELRADSNYWETDHD